MARRPGVIIRGGYEVEPMRRRGEGRAPRTDRASGIATRFPEIRIRRGAITDRGDVTLSDGAREGIVDYMEFTNAVGERNYDLRARALGSTGITLVSAQEITGMVRAARPKAFRTPTAARETLADLRRGIMGFMEDKTWGAIQAAGRRLDELTFADEGDRIAPCSTLTEQCRQLGGEGYTFMPIEVAVGGVDQYGRHYGFQMRDGRLHDERDMLRGFFRRRGLPANEYMDANWQMHLTFADLSPQVATMDATLELPPERQYGNPEQITLALSEPQIKLQ